MLLLSTLVFYMLTLVSAQNVGRFWHVTDFHYDNTYFTEQLSCNDDVPNPGPFGDYWCDSPWALVQSAVDFMAETSRGTEVDFAIWTGDTVAHIADSNTTLPENMRIMREVTELLATNLPGIPVYASLGNHDFYPSDQAEGNESEIYHEVAEMWQAWISNRAQVHRFEQGGFYSAHVANATKLRLLALNTNLYFSANKATAGLEDPAGQFIWMIDQLEKARANDEKVIITGHVPAGPLTRGLVNWFYPAHKKRFVEILLTYSDVIAATHFGHDHQDGFKILQNSDGSQSVSQFTAPSVTPWRYKISTPVGEVSGAPHNPAIRLVEYDRDTGAHLDYHQYFINLTDTNTRNQSNWSKLYSFRAAYDVPDMSVASMRTLFSRLRDGGGRTYTSRYCMNALASRMDSTCTDEMRGEVYCAGLYYDVSDAKECVKGYLKRINGAETTTTKANATVFILASIALAVKCLR